MTVVFVDRITFSSLLRIWTLGRSTQAIWHFEPIAQFSQRLLGIFRIFGLIRAKLYQVDQNISKMRKKNGERQDVQLLSIAWDICSKIKQDHLAKNPLIKAMESEWDTRKTILYFEKSIEKEVNLECLRIGLVEWILRAQLHIAPAQCVLLIGHKEWFSYLETYAYSQGIRLVSYEYLRRIVGLLGMGFRLCQASRKALANLLRAVCYQIQHMAKPDSLQRSVEKSIAKQQPAATTIAISYWHRKLSFDPTERSEFFWLNESGIPYSEVLLYDYVSDKLLDAETLEQLSASGVRLLGHGPGIPAWQPTKRMFAVRRRTQLKLIRGLLICLVQGHRISYYYIRNLWVLARAYSYWYDFYAFNRVKVNIGTLNTSVAQTLALDAMNGVTAAYQYTASNILPPTTLFSAGENVQFVFSPLFDQLRRSLDTPIDFIVQTGFIYDNAIQAVRTLDRVAETKKQLQDKGAHFILCFFDENSADRWDIAATHEEAGNDYEYLLKWLLADPTLGIVFKPKKPFTLLQRIARASDLIKQAMQTGRCRFLTGDALVDSIYPSEAALMADVCIGKLIGGTASLEARLAGVPTILIDTSGFHSHPFYKRGYGRFVFSDWESLRAAVEQYRATPEAYPKFGDWSTMLNELDPFRDGQASLRMSLYVRWVYEALKQGFPKQDALILASERYVKRWGEERVTMVGKKKADFSATGTSKFKI